MEEELRSLLTQSFSNQGLSNEQRNDISFRLLEIYKIPDAIPFLLNIILNSTGTIHHAAVIGLQNAIGQTWVKIVSTSSNAEQIKSMILQALDQEHVKTILHNIVRAITPVFETECMKWEQLHSFIFSHASAGTPQALETAMYTATYTIQYLPPELFVQLLPQYIQMAAGPLSSTDSPNFENISTAIGLIAVLIRSSKEEQLPLLAEPFRACITFFVEFLKSRTNEQYVMTLAANQLHFALQSNPIPIPPSELLNLFLNTISQNFQEAAELRISGLSLLAIFTSIEDIIQVYGKDLREHFREVLEVSLMAASSCYDVSGSLEDEEDPMYILEIVEVAAIEMKPRNFFEIFEEMFSKISNNPSPSLIASLYMALYRCIDSLTEAVASSISPLCSLLSQGLNVEPNLISVREICADSIYDLAPKLNDDQTELGNELIKQLCEQFSVGHISLANRSLKALSKLLMSIDINEDLIEPIFTQLQSLLTPQAHEAGIIQSNVSEVLSSLVFSAGNSITGIASSLFPIIVQMTLVDESIDSVLKANGIEALGNLLRFAPALAESENGNPSIEQLLRAAQSGDCELRSSAAIALGNCILARLKQLPVIVPAICDFITASFMNDQSEQNDQASQSTLQSKKVTDLGEVDSGDEEEEEAEFIRAQGQVNSLSNAILLVKHLAKICPELLPNPTVNSTISDWWNFCIGQITCWNEDLEISSMLACLYLTMAFPEVTELISKFLSAVIKNFSSDGPSVVGTCFKIFERLITFTAKTPPHSEFWASDFPRALSEAMKAGEMGLRRNLTCQKAEEGSMNDDDLNLSMNLYRFYAAIATNRDDLMGTILPQFIDHGKFVMKNASPFETMEYIGVIRQIYSRESYPSRIAGNPLNTYILEYALNSVENCDFTVIPEPILLLKTILERDPNSLEKMTNRRKGATILDAVEWINQSLLSDYDGQMHFWTTITDSISFIFTTAKLGLNLFNLSEIFSSILDHLPVRGDDMEAENIYSYLLVLSSNPEILSNFESQLLRVFVQTLGLKEETFNAFQLKEETKKEMINFVKGVMKKMVEKGTDPQPMLIEFLQAEYNIDIFSHRVQ